MPVMIEPMRENDLDEVMQLEQECFRSPWKRFFFVEDMKRSTSCLLVARDDDPGGTRAGRLAGYVVMWLVADELHLANIVVRPEYRRRGVGGALLREVIESGRESGCRRVFLEVRQGNDAALGFYGKFGFSYRYTRKRYYPDGEDALILEKEL